MLSRALVRRSLQWIDSEGLAESSPVAPHRQSAIAAQAALTVVSELSKELKMGERHNGKSYVLLFPVWHSHRAGRQGTLLLTVQGITPMRSVSLTDQARFYGSG